MRNASFLLFVCISHFSVCFLFFIYYHINCSVICCCSGHAIWIRLRHTDERLLLLLVLRFSAKYVVEFNAFRAQLYTMLYLINIFLSKKELQLYPMSNLNISTFWNPICTFPYNSLNAHMQFNYHFELVRCIDISAYCETTCLGWFFKMSLTKIKF